MRLSMEKSLLEQMTIEQFRQNLVLLKAEEIEIPKKWMLELLNTIEALQQENEQLQELANAKADGRMVVLPCKIGDKVWFLEKQLDIANGTCSTVISEYIVTEIRGNKYNPLWYMTSSERCTHRDFHPTELGKTVFLTREEAEKALEVSE